MKSKERGKVAAKPTNRPGSHQGWLAESKKKTKERRGMSIAHKDRRERRRGASGVQTQGGEHPWMRRRFSGKSVRQKFSWGKTRKKRGARQTGTYKEGLNLFKIGRAK